MEPKLLLRVSGVLAGVVLGLSAALDSSAQRGKAGPLTVVDALLVVAFAAGFWYNTSAAGGRAPGWRRALVLALQIFVATQVALEMLVVAVACMPLVVGRRRLFVWLGVMVGLCLLVAGMAAYTGDFAVSEIVAHVHRPLGMALTVLMILAWLLFAFSAGYLILALESSRREKEWALAQAEASQHLLAETSRMGERLRISRELHDTMGHHLMGLSVSLEVASHRCGAEALPSVERARLVARLLSAEIREVLAHQREERGFQLRPALETLAAAMHDPECRLEMEGEWGAVTPDAARALYRAAQEALTNAGRHSRARMVTLTLRAGDGQLRFEVHDDGRGAAGPKPGNGLRGMRERFEELGGGLEVETAPGQGFTLRGWLPAAGGGE